MRVLLDLTERVGADLKQRYKVDKVAGLVEYFRKELEKSLAQGTTDAPGTDSRVAEIPTRRIMTGVDYRAILFQPGDEEPLVAIARPIDPVPNDPDIAGRGADAPGPVTKRFLVTSIEPAASLRIRGVDFGRAVPAVPAADLGAWF